MSEAKSAQRGVKMRLRANAIIRTILTPFAFIDLNYCHGSMVVY